MYQAHQEANLKEGKWEEKAEGCQTVQELDQKSVNQLAKGCKE